MAEPDLIQQQRELLRALRQATAQRTKTEADAEAHRKGDEAAAATALNQTSQTATAQLTEVRGARERANVAEHL